MVAGIMILRIILYAITVLRECCAYFPGNALPAIICAATKTNLSLPGKFFPKTFARPFMATAEYRNGVGIGQISRNIQQ